MRWKVFPALLILFLSIAPVSASDGVLEINQTCAAGPGCFPGDTPGFPVQITVSGSYILTSNLVMAPLVHGITTILPGPTFPQKINASIDLNGFSISSTTTCSGDPLVCSPTSVSDGSGIFLAAIDHGSFLIHNGTVEGMAMAGVFCDNQCIVRDLVVNNNGLSGVLLNGSAQNIYAFSNGGNGITTSNLGTVQNCTADRNQESGFFGSANYLNNYARDNGTYGFQGNPGSTYIGNSVTGGDIGFRCFSCAAHNNAIVGVETTGIDFENSAGIYGGNLITAGDQSVLNAGNAVTSAPNSCTPACP